MKLEFIASPTERTTAFTDLLMSLIAAGLGFIMLHQGQSYKVTLWAWLLGLIMFSSLLGAVAHGYKMSARVNQSIWQPINLALVLFCAALCLCAGLFEKPAQTPRAAAVIRTAPDSSDAPVYLPALGDQSYARRPVYPYSVIPGGILNRAELARAIEHDPVVARHYSGFLTGNARIVMDVGAVIAMTRSMARELGADAITVNAVAPGLTLVEATEYIPAERHRLYVDGRAIQRQQTPADVCGAVTFLLSGAAGFITGQLLAVNGGFVMH